ncbi:hypothetical protein VIGAN_11057500 [Vigna angularis var. angularis]|uniref:Hydroxyproline O-arabinosyltransferase-like domain-containing protein n=1 Tax=Vigna angularis var. angularis TaxID=157739 RepID=A0A0S3T7V6_PHAAN|nr:hypothetical protein VIGAN_11057500 [Vigna angularis var. angularis]
MAEPDHIFVNPLPNLAYGSQPAAFPFFYIKPNENEKVLRKFYPEEKGLVTNIDPIGNSPVIIKKVSELVVLVIRGEFEIRWEVIPVARLGGRWKEETREKR